MGIFKNNPAKLRADFEARLRARMRDRDGAAEELQKFEAKIIDRAEAARALVADGGFADPKLGVVENEMRAAQDRVKSLVDGIAKINKDISELQSEITADIDREQRAESARTIDQWISEWDDAAKLFDNGCRAVEAISALTSPTVPEAGGTQAFSQDARQQLPAAVAMISACLKSHKAGLLAGGGKASLPKVPEPPPKLVVVPPAPTLNIFALKNLKFVNDAGVVVCIGGKKRSDVPEALGRLAISSGLALPISDPRCRDIGYNASPFQPDEGNCEWLGKPGRDVPPRFVRPGPAPIHSSLTRFEPHPGYINAKPFTVTVPRGPEPEPMAKTGTRSADEE